VIFFNADEPYPGEPFGGRRGAIANLSVAIGEELLCGREGWRRARPPPTCRIARLQLQAATYSHRRARARRWSLAAPRACESGAAEPLEAEGLELHP